MGFADVIYMHKIEKFNGYVRICYFTYIKFCKFIWFFEYFIIKKCPKIFFKYFNSDVFAAKSPYTFKLYETIEITSK